jgi:crotonobetainyl-CoA:carnitine CoA-transferase CaiB-like acyl-CoA transferase
MTLPLEGVKVVEFAEHAFVPASAAVLGEWGADVIKLERREGDALRAIGHLPGFGFSYYFELFNRNKRGLAIDIEIPAGRAILERLVRDADVFVTNHLPRVQRRLRTSPADIFALNRQIVYARGSGQGQRGPDAEAGGNDNISYWSRSGIGYMLSDADGDGIIPQRGAIGDAPSGIALAAGILAGLLHARSTGQGVEVNASLFSTGMWTLGPDIVLTSLTGDVPPRRHDGGRTAGSNPMGIASPLAGVYLTADRRQLALSMTNERRYWPRACAALGLDELAEAFADTDERHAHEAELRERFAEVIGSLPADDVAAQLRAQDCVFGFINTPLDVLHDTSAAANGYLLSHPTHETMRLPAVPAQFDEALPALRRPAPSLGEHSREVLLELGYTPERVDALHTDGVVGADPSAGPRH